MNNSVTYEGNSVIYEDRNNSVFFFVIVEIEKEEDL